MLSVVNCQIMNMMLFAFFFSQIFILLFIFMSICRILLYFLFSFFFVNFAGDCHYLFQFLFIFFGSWPIIFIGNSLVLILSLFEFDHISQSFLDIIFSLFNHFHHSYIFLLLFILFRMNK